MIKFKLVSSSGSKFDGEAYEVLIPTEVGTVALYEDHMPMISAGTPGVISVRKTSSDSDQQLKHYAVSGGVVQIDGKNVSYLSDDVTTPEDVSEEEALEAMSRAEELVKNSNTQVALEEAKHMLRHSSARLHLARLKSRRHN